MLASVDRQARGGTVAAEALEVTGARGEGAVQVERPRSTVPSPSSSRRGAGDEDDRAGGTARRGARRRSRSRLRASPRSTRRSRAVAASARAARRRPRSASRRIRSSTAWRSRFSSSRTSAQRRASSGSSVSTSSSATSGRPSRPAALIRGARRKPTGAGVDGCRIDVCAPHERLKPRTRASRASARSPAVASARFSSTSGTTSAIVASATRSRFRRIAGWSKPRSACAELVARRLFRTARGTDSSMGASRRSGSREARLRVGGGRSRRPRGRERFASAISSTAVIPQSTVSTRPTPSSASRSSVSPRDAVSLFEPAR